MFSPWAGPLTEEGLCVQRRAQPASSAGPSPGQVPNLTWSAGAEWLPSDRGQATGAGHCQQKLCSCLRCLGPRLRRLQMLGTSEPREGHTPHHGRALATSLSWTAFCVLAWPPHSSLATPHSAHIWGQTSTEEAGQLPPSWGVNLPCAWGPPGGGEGGAGSRTLPQRLGGQPGRPGGTGTGSKQGGEGIRPEGRTE